MHLSLYPLDPDRAEQIAAGDRSWLSSITKAPIPKVLIEAATAQRDLYRRTGQVRPWIGYLALEHGTGAPLGICSFKRPLADGVAEIAYFTFPPHEGKGVAGAMALGVVGVAQSQPELRELTAHTLPEESASTKLLRRLNFQLAGPIEDPEDGTVWRWRLPVRD